MHRKLDLPWYEREGQKARTSANATRHAADEWMVKFVGSRHSVSVEDILEKTASKNPTKDGVEKFMARLVAKRLVERLGNGKWVLPGYRPKTTVTK